MSKFLGCFLLLTFYGFIQGEDIGEECKCGLMREGTMEEILVHTTNVKIPCGAQAAQKCRTLCLALADAARESGPSLICERVENANNLKLEMYTKACDARDWTFSGFRSTKPVCCRGGMVRACNDMVDDVV